MDNTNTDKIKAYKNQVEYCLEVGEGPVLRDLRDKLHGIYSQEINDIDEAVFDYIMYLDDVADYLLIDNIRQPIANWWWHLGKIRNKTYPADLLPDHLRTIYSESSGGQVAA